MTLLEYGFSSGHAVDLVLVFMACEFAILALRRPPAARRAAMTTLVFALAPGACLLLALRAAMVGAGWPWVAGLLTLSLPAHLVDLARRKL